MFAARASGTLCRPKAAAHFSRAVAAPLLHTPCQAPASSLLCLRLATTSTTFTTSATSTTQHKTLPPRMRARAFSTTRPTRLPDNVAPAPEPTAHIRLTPPAWPHHGYTEAEMLAVVPGHRPPATIGDHLAWWLIRTSRWCMDTATGMSKEQQTDGKRPMTAVVAEKPLTEEQWLVRFIFLESIAGVPGMVAAMLRHLRSLRAMKRDNGWIETLLEESYNERLHLLTFLKLCEPGWFLRAMILGAQGVYFNAMFVAYLLSPRICHRFVGYLEEEAVHTYTRCLRELDAGLMPKWADPNFQIPDIAVKYWNIPEGKRTMRHLILYIRADEASHRGVNHTLGNLDQKQDPNPFVSTYDDGHKLLPMTNPKGWERSEVL